MQLRPYQQAAVDGVYEAWREHDSTLLVLPTGCGKTVCFAHVIKRLTFGRAMVLAHREELIWQAAAKIKAVIGEEPEIEMADHRADRGHLFTRSRVVVSSIQTQCAGLNGASRMSRFKPEQFGCVIIDEAHHAPAKSYRRVIRHYRTNPDCKLLGVTATPDRADELALGKVFKSVASRYEILDAITDGYLVPIVTLSKRIKDLNFAKMRLTAGDLNGRDLAAEMEREMPLHGVSNATFEHAFSLPEFSVNRCIEQSEQTGQPIHELVAPLIRGPGKKTLVFAASVAHAERLCEIFNRYLPGSSRWVCGKTPKDERRLTLTDYARGRFSILVNVGVFTEGFDEPGVQTVVLARPTTSRALFAQMIGRGTRPLPGLVDHHDKAEVRRAAIASSPKPRVEVIDFVGNCGRHHLVTAADILGGKYDNEVVARVIRKAQKDGEEVDVADALRRAKDEVAEERRQREEQEERERQERARLIASVEYTTEVVDPFTALDIPRKLSWPKGPPPTPNMINLLKKNGIDPSNMNRTEAGQLCGEIIRRYKAGEATYRQARQLAKYGRDIHVSRDEASKTIEAIKDHESQRRPAILEVPAVAMLERF